MIEVRKNRHMSKTYLEFIQDLFQDPSKVTTEMLHIVIEETKKYLTSLETAAKSTDIELHEKIAEEVLEVKGVLFQALEVLCKKTGISVDQIALAMNDPTHLEMQERSLLEKAKQELEPPPPIAPSRKFKRKKANIYLV